MPGPYHHVEGATAVFGTDDQTILAASDIVLRDGVPSIISSRNNQGTWKLRGFIVLGKVWGNLEIRVPVPLPKSFLPAPDEPWVRQVAC